MPASSGGNDSRRRAWYAGVELETSIAEIAFHKRRFLKKSDAAKCTITGSEEPSKRPPDPRALSPDLPENKVSLGTPTSQNTASTCFLPAPVSSTILLIVTRPCSVLIRDNAQLRHGRTRIFSRSIFFASRLTFPLPTHRGKQHPRLPIWCIRPDYPVGLAQPEPILSMVTTRRSADRRSGATPLDLLEQRHFAVAHCLDVSPEGGRSGNHRQ